MPKTKIIQRNAYMRDSFSPPSAKRSTVKAFSEVKFNFINP